MPIPDVLIIGAGAAGLLAARQLAAAGRQVVVLEALGRLGGRVHTFTPPGFSAPIEAGAEFIHGAAPLTRALLAEAGLGWHTTAGHTYQVKNGQLQDEDSFFAHLPPLLAELQQLREDAPLAEFLARAFPGDEHAALRTFATQFAEGYDAADASRVSSWALRDEWATSGVEGSLRPAGGYGALLHWLAAQAQMAGATLHLGTPVQEIRWQPGTAEVLTTAGATFQARQVLCTLPLGVWQRAAGQPGHVALVPELPLHRAAATQLGFGSVIKVVLEFATPFWQARLPELEFLLSDAPVPTWWGQLTNARPLLTGWLGGPAAQRLRDAPASEVLDQALTSLSYLLATPPAELAAQLRASYVGNWGAEPYAHGAYSYPTVGAGAARTALAAPVANTLFFAGEGLYQGVEGGTVEAALASGQAAARALLGQPRP